MLLNQNYRDQETLARRGFSGLLTPCGSYLFCCCRRILTTLGRPWLSKGIPALGLQTSLVDCVPLGMCEPQFPHLYDGVTIPTSQGCCED